MMESSIVKILNAENDDDEKIAEIVELILDQKDEGEWNGVEHLLISIINYHRWITNGGHRSYLLMPSSIDSQIVLKGLDVLNEEKLSSALKSALSIFRGCAEWDVDSRQSFELSEECELKLRQLDEVFDSGEEGLLRKLIDYIENNLGSLLE